jgi:hypothetical protein
MLRKITLSALAVAALGLTALAPSTADAKHWHKHHHHWGHKHVYVGGPVVYGGVYAGCWIKRWVPTPHGPRLKRIYVCY